MVQLWGVGSDESKGDWMVWWGFAWSEAILTPFLQRNIILTLPQVNQEIIFSHLLFVGLIRSIYTGFWLILCLKHCIWGFSHDSLGGSPPVFCSCFLDELQCQHREYWVVVKMIVQLLSSAASTAPYPPSGNPECHRRLWPLLGCPLFWRVGPTPSHLNSACCVVFFHSYISFNLVPYRARQLCCLQTLVRYFIFINMSSFSLISLSGLPVLLYVAVVLREVLNFLYAGINWSGSQVALCPVLSFRAVCCTSHHICLLRCLVNRRGDKGTWKGKKQSEEWSWRLGI